MSELKPLRGIPPLLLVAILVVLFAVAGLIVASAIIPQKGSVGVKIIIDYSDPNVPDKVVEAKLGIPGLFGFAPSLDVSDESGRAVRALKAEVWITPTYIGTPTSWTYIAYIKSYWDTTLKDEGFQSGLPLPASGQAVKIFSGEWLAPHIETMTPTSGYHTYKMDVSAYATIPAGDPNAPTAGGTATGIVKYQVTSGGEILGLKVTINNGWLT